MESRVGPQSRSGSTDGAVLRPAGRHLVGLMLAGWGLSNLVKAVIDHQILTVHHVNPCWAPLSCWT